MPTNDATMKTIINTQPERAEHLTRREVEILRLIATAESNKGIASILGISAKTVEKHRQSLHRKIGVVERVGLTHYALAAGLVVNRFLVMETQR